MATYDRCKGLYNTATSRASMISKIADHRVAVAKPSLPGPFVNQVGMKPTAPTDGLRANALSFTSVLTQGITHIAPAMGLVVTVQFVTRMAGIASPLAYGIAFLIVMMLGVCLAQLALHLPSAGGYYTYVSRSLNPKAGFLTGWMFFFYDPLTAAVNLAYLGFLVQTTLRIEAHIHCPWYVIYIVFALLITLLIYRGIEISAAFVMWLTIIEVVIMLALGVASLMHPGDGRIHLQDLFRVHDFRNKGFYLAIVFSIFTFTGFEAIAPLAEETRIRDEPFPAPFFSPLRSWASSSSLPRWPSSPAGAIATSMASARSAENPVILLAKRLWGAAWIFVLVAVINSILGAAISGTNAAVRVFFAMGRARSLPAALECHPSSLSHARERHPAADHHHPHHRHRHRLLDRPGSGVLLPRRHHDAGPHLHLLRRATSACSFFTGASGPRSSARSCTVCFPCFRRFRCCGLPTNRSCHCRRRPCATPLPRG